MLKRMKLKERVVAVLGFCLFLVISIFLYFHAIQNELQLYLSKENQRPVIRDRGRPGIRDRAAKEASKSPAFLPTRLKFHTEANISAAAFMGMQVNVKLQELNFSRLRDDSQRIQLMRDLIADLRHRGKNLHNEDDSIDSMWRLAKGWVDGHHVHPEHTPEMGMVLLAMKGARIVQAGAARKGTQNKIALLLEGGQKAIFKPMKYSRDFVIEGLPYAGWDRHNGEIAAFHLNRILGFRLTPLTVGRVVDLEEEIKPIASKILLKTFFEKDGEVCLYGVCYYCNRQDPVCSKEGKLEGALILWLPDSVTLQRHPNPWRRNYKANTPARWEKDLGFCQKVRLMPYFKEEANLLSLIDSAVFDYLIGNADRHTVEAPAAPYNAPIMLIDNGKSFGNPYWDEFTILAPLYQCCRLRRFTYSRLKTFVDHLGSSLGEMLTYDPLPTILTNAHLEALDRRLRTVLATVHACIDKIGSDKVFV